MYLYNYNFENQDETVKNEFQNIPIDYAKKRMLVNLVLTDKKLLFFRDLTKESPLQTRIYELPNYELIIDLLIKNNIKNISYNGQDTQLKINNKSIMIYNFDLKKYL